MEIHRVSLQCAQCKNRIYWHAEKIETQIFPYDPDLQYHFNLIIREGRCRLGKPMPDDFCKCDGFEPNTWDQTYCLVIDVSSNGF